MDDYRSRYNIDDTQKASTMNLFPLDKVVVVFATEVEKGKELPTPELFFSTYENKRPVNQLVPDGKGGVNVLEEDFNYAEDIFAQKTGAERPIALNLMAIIDSLRTSKDAKRKALGENYYKTLVEPQKGIQMGFGRENGMAKFGQLIEDYNNLLNKRPLEAEKATQPEA